MYTPVDVDIPGPTNDYHVDLNADGTAEFDIERFFTITKVLEFAPGVGIVTDPADGRTANLAIGTWIGPANTFSNGAPTIPGGVAEDQLNGTDGGTPVGHFQVSDGPGFIGVQFPIGGNTHYGWVGYEGIDAENDPAGHVYALAYENTPGAAIVAGDGIFYGIPGDYNADGAVGAPDYVVWRKNDGTETGFNTWRANFGKTSGSGAAAGQALSPASVPEPSSLFLLAAGAAGMSLYARR